MKRSCAAVAALGVLLASAPVFAEEPEVVSAAPSDRNAFIEWVVASIAADNPKPILGILLTSKQLGALCPDTPKGKLERIDKRSAGNADDIREAVAECRAMIDFNTVRVVDLKGGGFSGHFDDGACEHVPFYEMNDLRVLLEAPDGTRVQLRIDDPVTWNDTAFLITDNPRCSEVDPEEPSDSRKEKKGGYVPMD